MNTKKNSNQHGYDAENRLETICNRIFGEDLVVKSPVVHKPTGKEELTDVLIDLHNEVFVVQSKSISISTADLDEIKLKRVFRKLEDAQSQFRTFFRAQKNELRVEAQNALGIRYDLDWSALNKKIGIITLNLTDEQYEDPEFRFQIPNPIIESDSFDIHVFILRDLEQLANEYTTPGDFGQYLVERSRAFKSPKFLLGNELDLVAMLKTSYPDITEALGTASQYTTVFIEPGAWEGYVKNEEINSKKAKLLENSQMFDVIFEALRSSIEYEMHNYGTSNQEAVLKYRRFVSELSKIGRFQRLKFQEKALEKLYRAERRPFSYFVHSYSEANISVLFVATNDLDREKRLALIENLGSGVAHVVDTDRIVAIASPGFSMRGKFGYELLLGDTMELKEIEGSQRFVRFFKPPEHSNQNEWDVD